MREGEEHAFAHGRIRTDQSGAALTRRKTTRSRVSSQRTPPHALADSAPTCHCSSHAVFVFVVFVVVVVVVVV